MRIAQVAAAIAAAHRAYLATGGANSAATPLIVVRLTSYMADGRRAVARFLMRAGGPPTILCGP